MSFKGSAAKLLIVGGVLVVGAAGLAGPLLFDETKLSDEIQSLAGLTKLAVEVEPMPGDLRELGLTAERIRNDWVGHLEKAGFEIVTGREHPRLYLKVRGGTEPEAGSGYAFVIEMKLYQPVRIERLDRTLNVPTYTTGALGLVTSGLLGKQIQAGLDRKIRRFIELSQQATRQAQAQPAGKE
jgi:hypothetical protein